jgi:hypothetical protein
MMRVEVGVLMLALLCPMGCAPPWHNGGPLEVVRHGVEGAQVIGDSLSVQGGINWLFAFTDYGVKVCKAEDNEGRTLQLRSYRIFWMKEYRWEAEFTAPSEGATTVSIDLQFFTRSGFQRIRKTLPISRSTNVDYRSQLKGWKSCDSEN